MKNEEENARKRIISIVVIFMVFILLILYLGYTTYKDNVHNMNNTNQEENKEQENETNNNTNIDTDINKSKVASTRLIGVIDALNNPFIENMGDNIGYIYNKGYINVNELSNDYIIYTALYYLKERNDLIDNNDPRYQKKVSKSVVDATIKNIFGDVKYNPNAYLGNGVTCPNGYYNSSDEYFYINNNCEIGTNKIENYNIKIVQGLKSVDIYQAIGYASYNGIKKVYKDKAMQNLVKEDNNYEISITDYQEYKQYKFSFVKGSDDLYHFYSIDIVN